MSGKMSRRSFLKRAAGTGLALTIPQGLAGCGSDSESSNGPYQGSPSPVLFISIDSLPPSYLTLNSRGERGGREGDWLMPNLMHFLEEATLFDDTRGYLPAAMLWPDLVLGAKNGWQIPIYGGVLANIGIQLPAWFPPVTLFLGGHGAIDTLPIVMAVRGPNVAKGKVVSDPTYEKNHRISDLAVTVAQMYGLTLRTTTVGQDLTLDLA